MNILHGLAAAGAESDAMADAAADAWPDLMDRAIRYAEDEPNVYKQDTWGSWAAAALLPDPPVWANDLHHELSGAPIDWVNPAELTDQIERWLDVGIGETRCADALIRLVRKLPIGIQATRGLDWVTRLCIQDHRVVIVQTRSANDWLTKISVSVEECGTLPQWQALVDALVVAGNLDLAPFSA